ncbi:hypothetical protein ACGF12_15505 [Kitasatospora sp. NPDC048296]|uniref:hypothetical protein n=1 Tax=Kitasatospora sp. NPDC048296 TaxID=3364048 RepID=UPI00371DE763
MILGSVDCRAVYGQVTAGTWYATGNPAAHRRARFAAAPADPDDGPEPRRPAAERAPAE